MDPAWRDDLRARFSDWETEAALARWPEVRASLTPGQSLSGEVVAHAHFGIWLDAGLGFPVLLLITRMTGIPKSPDYRESYPAIGSTVEGRLVALGSRGEIGITQLESDR